MNPHVSDLHTAPEANQARAEFYLCLARAFATPLDENGYRAARDYLAGDLQALLPACGYDGVDALAAYREAMADIPDHQSLATIYARLFLVPGEHHPHLNTGVYLDGSLAGGSVRAMEQCYRRCGLETDHGFHDLPDHLVVQLEFVAWLYALRTETAPAAAPAMTPEEFLASFVARWSSALREDIESAGTRFALNANPYAALARLLEIAVQADAATATPAPVEAEEDEITRLRALYAGREPDAADLAVIREKLAADGLNTDHLGTPPVQRDQAAGLEPLTPPAPPRHRRA